MVRSNFDPGPTRRPKVQPFDLDAYAALPESPHVAKVAAVMAKLEAAGFDDKALTDEFIDSL